MTAKEMYNLGKHDKAQGIPKHPVTVEQYGKACCDAYNQGYEGQKFYRVPEPRSCMARHNRAGGTNRIRN